MRTARRIPLEEKLSELLPDVTRRCGRRIIYSSAADKASMEKLIATLVKERLTSERERLAA